uniref:F-box/WD repeat-containing protein 8-like n=1 Tax=Castor canadensis TaxID=51338 RepID=A0A8B7UI47_CASCN
MVAWDMIREVYSFVLYRWHTLELLKDSKDKVVVRCKFVERRKRAWCKNPSKGERPDEGRGLGGRVARPEPRSGGPSSFRPRRRTLSADGLPRGTWRAEDEEVGGLTMDEQGLEEFRRRWQEELAQAQALRKRRRPETAERRPRRPDVAAGRGEQASGYLALAQGLLEGAGRPPAARASRAERPDAASRSRSPPVREGAGGGEQLVDQLIRDLNEMDGVPFFDLQLPYELAINIFQYLDRKELGRCAQVSWLTDVRVFLNVVKVYEAAG